MPREEQRPTVDTSAVSWKKTLALSALLLLVGGGTVGFIFSTEPNAKRGGATKKTEMLVDVTRATRGTFRPEIVVTGNVRAEQDVVLSPRVGGQIVWQSPDLAPGAFVKKGAPLIRIDAADYRTIIQQRQSDLQQAMTELDLEKGRRKVAKREVAMYGEKLPEDAEQRALRTPILEAVRGRVRSAKAALHQAQLDLQRTTIEAPFSGQILSREVSVGSQVAPGDPVARLVGVDAYWVVMTVPRDKLRWLSFADEAGEEGADVRVRNRGSWDEGTYRHGRLDALIGALDEQTRMARVVATIPDPLARREGASDDMPILIIGDFVEARIRGNPIANVVRLERRHLRAGDTVWVMEDEKLSIRPVTVVMRDQMHAYVSRGLADGDRVVTTDLANVTEGAPLRLRSAESQDAGTPRE